MVQKKGIFEWPVPPKAAANLAGLDVATTILQGTVAGVVVAGAGAGAESESAGTAVAAVAAVAAVVEGAANVGIAAAVVPAADFGGAAAALARIHPRPLL